MICSNYSYKRIITIIINNLSVLLSLKNWLFKVGSVDTCTYKCIYEWTNNRKKYFDTETLHMVGQLVFFFIFSSFFFLLEILSWAWNCQTAPVSLTFFAPADNAHWTRGSFTQTIRNNSSKREFPKQLYLRPSQRNYLYMIISRERTWTIVAGEVRL